MASATTFDDQSLIASVIRSCIGFAQGCPIATFASNLPVHIARYELNRRYPLLEQVSNADDTYLQAPGDSRALLDAAANAEGYVYTAFAARQALLLETCGMMSNAKKVKVLLPNGGTVGIPQSFINFQGGEIPGFKCVGIYIAPNSVAGDAWRIRQLTAALESKLKTQSMLKTLDRINAMTDLDQETDLRQLRYNYIRRVAH